MIKNSPKIYKMTSDFDFSVNRFLDEGLRSILVVFLKIKDPDTEGTLKVRKFKIKKVDLMLNLPLQHCNGVVQQIDDVH